MNDKSDNSDTLHARRNQRGPLTLEQRERKQKRFLKVFAETANVKHSCKAAGIHRSTFYDWKQNDEAFQSLLLDTVDDANDTLEYAAYERGVHGVEEPIVSQGQLVYEYESLLDDEGKQRFTENGKPMMKRGKQVVKRVYSDTLLVTLLKARMPAKYREKSSVELTGKDGGPVRVNSDLKLLHDDELDQVEHMILRARERSGNA